MKPKIFLGIILIVFLLSGCTINYKELEKFEGGEWVLGDVRYLYHDNVPKGVKNGTFIGELNHLIDNRSVYKSYLVDIINGKEQIIFHLYKNDPILYAGLDDNPIEGKDIFTVNDLKTKIEELREKR